MAGNQTTWNIYAKDWTCGGANTFKITNFVDGDFVWPCDLDTAQFTVTPNATCALAVCVPSCNSSCPSDNMCSVWSCSITGVMGMGTPSLCQDCRKVTEIVTGTPVFYLSNNGSGCVWTETSFNNVDPPVSLPCYGCVQYELLSDGTNWMFEIIFPDGGFLLWQKPLSNLGCCANPIITFSGSDLILNSNTSFGGADSFCDWSGATITLSSYINCCVDHPPPACPICNTGCTGGATVCDCCCCPAGLPSQWQFNLSGTGASCMDGSYTLCSAGGCTFTGCNAQTGALASLAWNSGQWSLTITSPNGAQLIYQLDQVCACGSSSSSSASSSASSQQSSSFGSSTSGGGSSSGSGSTPMAMLGFPFSMEASGMRTACDGALMPYTIKAIMQGQEHLLNYLPGSMGDYGFGVEWTDGKIIFACADVGKWIVMIEGTTDYATQAVPYGVYIVNGIEIEIRSE